MKKLYFLFIISISLLINCSCNSMSDQVKTERTIGIINSCYTVTEYNPSDKTERIEIYLSKKIDEGVINNNEKFIIKECLKRTETSKCWSVK